MISLPEPDAALRVFEELALEAGRRIMEEFQAGFAVDRKSDDSPVTAADRAAERIILAGLRSVFPHIPCVAEEEYSEGVRPADLDSTFFLVDPLDGTREFVNRSGDFTVNIALVRDTRPELGVVYGPVSRQLYSGRPGFAEKLVLGPDGSRMEQHRIRVREASQPPVVVASRSHRTPQTDRFIESVAAAEIVSVGSSLKFCLVAQGDADIYPRFGRTMEWDTAAGDAVLRAAGGSTSTLDGQPLAYGKRNQPGDSDFANPYFIARGGKSAAPGEQASGS